MDHGVSLQQERAGARVGEGVHLPEEAAGSTVSGKDPLAGLAFIGPTLVWCKQAGAHRPRLREQQARTPGQDAADGTGHPVALNDPHLVVLSLGKLPLLQEGPALFFGCCLEVLKTSSGVSSLVTNLLLCRAGCSVR